MKKITSLFFVIVLGLIILSGCVMNPSVSISNGDRMNLEIDSSIQLNITNTTGLTGTYYWEASNDCVTVDNGYVTAVKEGTVIVTVIFVQTEDSPTILECQDSITITVTKKVETPEKIEVELRSPKSVIEVGETLTLDVSVTPASYLPSVKLEVKSGADLIEISGYEITALKEGAVILVAKYLTNKSREVLIEIVGKEITTDPYENVNKEEFYQNYIEAVSYQDAYYRSLHGLMSGSIEDQDQAPSIAWNQPTENGKLIKNSEILYSKDGNAYYIVDANGKIVDTVFKGGAYVTLEEVAAYVFAFGDVPANHSSSKKTKPTESIWGKYLRVNHTEFSGNTYKYPYEPALPDINGNGGDLQYYEMDLGTTGTDCDPSYDIREYNNGYSIERGAARIVYARYDKNGNQIIDINEKYVFYTYNHYNDFQEYLNYQGGWGTMFGNITGGGTLSSKYDYNPTPYVDVVLKSIVTKNLSLGNTLGYKDYIILEELNKKVFLA